MLRAAEVSQQLCRKLKRLGLKTDSSAGGDVDLVSMRERMLVGGGRSPFIVKSYMGRCARPSRVVSS